MVKSRYSWERGVELEDHTRRKHKILREYLSRYLSVRCAFPQQTRFRLAIVEAFAGGGRYKCGTPGSPIIFIEELRSATERLNLQRKVEGMAPIDIECFLLLNDAEPGTVAILKSHTEPLIAAARAETTRLHLRSEYFEKPFEELYPKVKELLENGRYKNALFNLDQYGHSDVQLSTLTDIGASFTSAEIFYTFSISSLLAFLHKRSAPHLAKQLGFLGVKPGDLESLEGQMSKKEWLGAAERLVFECFKSCAQFVSPFSINNPGGWRYWLIHFANNNYRARQEYNNVLHENSSMQAHYGLPGLDMLSYDPSKEGALYLFDEDGRARAKRQLMDDIPRLVTDFGDAVQVGQFYGSIYNMTPAHMDDIHAAMVENPDLEVLTDAGGGVRKKAATIKAEDTLRMKKQRTFFPIFFDQKKA